MAGVSTATVSRALSKPETVAKETRELVLEAAAQTGYRVNLAARNLRSHRTGTIVVMVPNLGNPFFSRILSGIESVVVDRGLSVLVVDTQFAKSKMDLVSNYIHHSRADGFIVLDGSLPDEVVENLLDSSPQRPVIFACEWLEDERFSFVRVNNRRGASLAIDHLVGLGHSRIGYINGPVENILTKARFEGALTGFNEHDITIDAAWQFQGDFSLESGAVVARQWFALEDRPSAIFCANDEMAFGLISELNQNGVKVPEDLSVVGFDDIDLSAHFIPPLTTIRQPRTELGVSAAEMLIKAVDDRAPGGELQSKVLPVELMVRGSTAAPADR